MNRHTPQHPPSRAARPLRRRIGMTLTEVLMALMVMGIGLVSVITLFPLSILRSVEATKLTNATATRINAEAKIKASVSSNDTGSSLEVIKSAILYDPDRDGNLSNTARHYRQNFIFDPLGAMVGIGDGRLPTLQPAVGDNFYNNTVFGDRPFPVNGTNYLRRYTFGLNSQGAAQEFVTSPDSFITLFDGIAGTSAAEHRTFIPPAANATELSFYGFPFGEYTGRRVQVTLIGSSATNPGKTTTAVLPGFTTSDTLVEFKRSASDPDLREIPARFASVDRVTVDLPENRYTWLATVRNTGSSPSVSVAVFFRRSFSAEDEKIYDIGKTARHTYFIENLNPNALPPGFKQGGWMFDLENFRWWKITQLKRDNANNGYWFATDPEEYDGGSTGIIQAVFPGNIIEVYNLKKD